ncbi:MAG: transposase [Deltaproteobacteria bacterium]|nr:transposase [Deltaproteobacteria bacterium]
MEQYSEYQKFLEMKTAVTSKSKKAAFIGIDIAKNKHIVSIGDNLGWGDDKTFPISNEATGYEKLLKNVDKLKSQYELIIFGVEASGGYERALSSYLNEKGFWVVRVPTVSVRREREFATQSWHKDDLRDAKAILRVMQRGIFHYYWFRDKKWENIDALVRLQIHLTQRAKELQIMIRVNVLPVVFPELNNYLKRLSTRFSETLLKNYPSPFHITEKGYEPFYKDMWQHIDKLGGKKEPFKKILAEIYKLAEHSIGKPMGYGDAKTLELRHLAEQ